MTATNPNDNRLQVRLSPEYQRMVAWLAKEMNRSSSDAVRQCIYETYVRMQNQTKKENHMINKDEIIDRVGGESWQDVVSEFGGQVESEVRATLDYMFPHDDNQELAQAIAEKVNQ